MMRGQGSVGAISGADEESVLFNLVASLQGTSHSCGLLYTNEFVIMP